MSFRGLTAFLKSQNIPGLRGPQSVYPSLPRTPGHVPVLAAVNQVL